MVRSDRYRTAPVVGGVLRGDAVGLAAGGAARREPSMTAGASSRAPRRADDRPYVRSAAVVSDDRRWHHDVGYTAKIQKFAAGGGDPINVMAVATAMGEGSMYPGIVARTDTGRRFRHGRADVAPVAESCQISRCSPRLRPGPVKGRHGLSPR